MYIDEIVNELKQNLTGSDLRVKVHKSKSNGYMEINDMAAGFMYRVPFEAVYVSQCEMASQCFYLDNEDYRAIDKAIKQILKTPATKLLAEPKYVVMPENLDSSHGPQCLTTDVTGRVFFAAKKNGLKQKFSFDELQEIINRTADGAGISWLTPVINQCKKLVE